jgi:hypothetical protein
MLPKANSKEAIHKYAVGLIFAFSGHKNAYGHLIIKFGNFG